jgi:UDP-N-acetylmuramoyl-tripeptide--D-alanyl-D-alanine ligase
MVQDYSLIIIFFWVPQFVSQLLLWLYWIQDKEYRMDRFRVLLKGKYGWKELQIQLTAVKIITLSFLIIFETQPLLNLLTLSLLFLTLDVIYIKKIFLKSFRRPVITKRIINILMIVFIISFPLALVLIYSGNVAFLLILEFGLFAGLVLGVALTGVITGLYIKKEEERAIQKIKSIRPKIIAVTGSFGKTTTKDFIFTLVSEKYKAVKNEGSRNTIFGLLNTINDDLGQNTDYLILEMGAYKRGEIERLCHIAKPDISVITAIEPQHMELFGNFENIIKAKYEIVENLSPNGIAIFNLDNEETKKLFGKTNKDKHINSFGYSSFTKADKENNSIMYKIIKKGNDGVVFQVYFQDKVFKFIAPIETDYLVSNLACSILIGLLLGLNEKEIKKALRKIKLPQKTMSKTVTKFGSVVYDNSFNTNLSGFEAAIRHLIDLKGSRKVIFMTGIIELGTKSSEIHERLSFLMKSGIDKIYLRNREFEKHLRKHLSDKDKLVCIDDTLEISAAFEKELKTSGNMILLEGRLPVSIFKIFKKYKSASKT